MVCAHCQKQNQREDIPVSESNVAQWGSLFCLFETSSRYPNVPGNYVDIVKDVINIISAHVSADKFVGRKKASQYSSYRCGSVAFL